MSRIVRADEVRVGDVTSLGEVIELRDPPKAMASTHVSIVTRGVWGAVITDTVGRAHPISVRTVAA